MQYMSQFWLGLSTSHRTWNFGFLCYFESTFNFYALLILSAKQRVLSIRDEKASILKNSLLQRQIAHFSPLVQMPVKRVRGSSNNVGVQVKSFFFAHAFLLSTKLRRKSFDLKELNLAITDCPLDLSRRAPNQVVVTKCKEKFYKDLIAHFSFAPKRCRSIKVFYPLPTKIFLYLYLYL